MVRVVGHTKRSRTGKLVYVRSYDKAGRMRQKRGFAFVPEEETAAVYDPSKPRNPFTGRISRGERPPRGMRAYPFDDTQLVQAEEKNRRTLGRTPSAKNK
jgi:hypothetical protein